MTTNSTPSVPSSSTTVSTIVASNDLASVYEGFCSATQSIASQKIALQKLVKQQLEELERENAAVQANFEQTVVSELSGKTIVEMVEAPISSEKAIKLFQLYEVLWSYGWNRAQRGALYGELFPNSYIVDGDFKLGERVYVSPVVKIAKASAGSREALFERTVEYLSLLQELHELVLPEKSFAVAVSDGRFYRIEMLFEVESQRWMLTDNGSPRFQRHFSSLHEALKSAPTCD